MVQLDWSELRQTRWRELAVRFLFGGLITAATGIVARKFGPGVGGLFLAFPAILPASVTLIEKHEKEKKQNFGLNGSQRAHGAASLDAAGAALGSVGLIAFALLVWWSITSLNAHLVLFGSAFAWFAVSAGVWRIRRLKPRLLRWHRRSPKSGF